MASRKITISKAVTQDDIASVSTLFTAYAKSLAIDLTFQNFSNEMSSMPGKYTTEKGGVLLLARDDTGDAIGCVGLRSLRDTDICEMKRLYVSPAGRGTGAGRALAQAVIDEARKLGYARVRLDTLPTMTTAISLYKSFGFKQIDPYYTTPLSETVFLELSL